MLKCWSHIPEDRPSFTELSKELWDLEHKGNTYVNVESLMKQSMEDDQGKKNLYILIKSVDSLIFSIHVETNA